jgi:GGDEF domain-containing protein
VAELAASGPALCRAVLEAVGSDDALARLVDTDAPAELSRLAGAQDGPALVAAAEALRRSISESATATAPPPHPAVLTDLSDRLAHVCAHLAATAMTARAADRRRPEAATAGPPRPEPVSPPGEDDNDLAPPIELTARGEDAAPAPLWLAALERRLADGGRFALLLVEVDGAGRLSLAEGEDAARELFGRVGRAVRSAVRRSDLLAHEQDGRLWVIAPDAGRTGADALAGRVAAAVEGAATARGVPLTASIGLALYPDDGRDAAALTGQAEEAVLAARAAGVRVAGGVAGHPAAPGPRLVP